MDKEKIKYYQKLARFIYLREMQDKSFDEDTKDMIPEEKDRFKKINRDFDIDKNWEDIEKSFEDMNGVFGYVARTPMRQGERIVMGKEMHKLGKELLDDVNTEESHITIIDLMKMTSTDLPPKHIRQINGYRNFVWNDVEFELNEEQAEILENIYNHFVETGTPYIVGKQFKSPIKRDIVRTFEGSNVIGTILVKVKQGDYRIELDF